MLLPLSWLKEYVDVNVSPKELEEKLFSCGFEVEKTMCLGEKISGIYTGKIESVEKHPNADRLLVCKVDLGSLGKRQICTAATNVFEGAIVPCALDGAVVLKGDGVQKIKNGMLRGEPSEGMFCSGEELGINDDFYEGAETNGILILDKDTPLGEEIKKAIGLDDYIFDVSITANRPDCQCVTGLAREVAAALQTSYNPPSFSYSETKTKEKITVEVQEKTLCPRYIGQYVKDVKIGPSPRWLRRRLSLCGLRSVSNIVDITNYVLLEIGQPMHAFNRGYLRKDKIIVRRAKEGEKLTTLDKREHTLCGELLICDGEGPIGVAGVMGGLNSEIKPDTSEVFFESASFARDSVRKTSRALNLRSDSSARFEKGVEPQYTPEAGMARALHLVEELGCGVVTSARQDISAFPKEEKVISASYSSIRKLLGISIPKKTVDEILTRLSFRVEGKGDSFTAAVPLFRDDIDSYPDLAEEVIRMLGYDKIKPTFLENTSVTNGGRTLAQKQELKFKRTVQNEGFSEAVTYSFYSPKEFDLFRLPSDAPERRALKILNPIGEDLSLMRTFLAPSMLEAIVRNQRRGNYEGKLFELAKVYLTNALPLDDFPSERERAVFGLWGGGDFFDLKGVFEAIAAAFDLKFSYERAEKPYLHPGISAEVRMGEKSVGYLGELHPEIGGALALERKVYLGELDYSALYPKFQKDVVYRGLPKFESISRDLAVVLDEKISCASVEASIRSSVKAVKEIELFDVYRDARLGANKKSLAFRLTFAPEENAEKPLSSEQVEKYFQKIVGALKKELGAELR